MSGSGSQSVVRRWFEEVFNAGNLDVADQVVARDHVLHDPAHPELAPGPNGTKELATFWRKSFPDVRITIEDEVAAGDRIVVRWRASCSSSGTPLAGIGNQAPYGSVTIEGIAIARVAGGQIQETWNAFDTGKVLHQLGFFPQDWPLWPPWWWNRAMPQDPIGG